MSKILENKKIIFEVMAIILIIIFAVSITPKTLQNDIYYTVSIGELILENGIDMEDHFSWQTTSLGTSLPYTYPHWLYDVMMYLIYTISGWGSVYISTCIFAAILGICIYKVNSRLTKAPIVAFIVTIGSLYLLKGYITARAQLVTFILFILLIYNIEKFLENKKIKNAIALFIIQTLIANLHAAVWPFAFVLYLPYIAEYIICELIEFSLYHKFEIFNLKRKIKKLINNPKNPEKLEAYISKLQELEIRVQRIKTKREENLANPYKLKLVKNKNTRWLILVMIITIITGFLTPIGTTPFTYTYLTLQGNSLDNINEHLPLTLIQNTPILCTLVILLGLLIFTKAKIRLSDIFMIGGLAFLMFATRRQTSMFALIGTIVFSRLCIELLLQVPNIKVPEDITEKLFNKFTGAVLILIVLIFSVNYFKDKQYDEYVDSDTYPVEASEWILENLDIENIKLYNEYNYGSYLIYKGIPVFIDSRCDLYTPEFTSTVNGVEIYGYDIFSDFLNSSNLGTYYGEIFELYGITHVLISEDSKINMIIQNADSEKYDLIYSDDNFVIYEVLEY